MIKFQSLDVSTSKISNREDLLSGAVEVPSFINNPQALMLGLSEVTEIGDSAFVNCSAMTSISIPFSITSLGKHVFKGCAGLKAIHCENAEPAKITPQTFQDYPGLSECTLYVPRGSKEAYAKQWDLFTTIEEEEPVYFYDLGVRFIFNENRTSVSVASFQKKSISGYQEIEETAEYNGVTYNVESIEIGAFFGCTHLESIYIHPSITSIPDYAFSGCENLTQTNLPGNLESIGNSAFEKCFKLVLRDLPCDLKEIGSRAFINCQSITEIVFYENVTSIGNGALSCCRKLKKIYSLASIPPVVPKILAEHFEYRTIKLYVPKGSQTEYNEAKGWNVLHEVVEIKN